ncbi:MAG: alkylhydroperoxidase [Rhodobacteraceae bacterium]|nr:alkylhydroperoxidase [Paracoccaceae bacterium]
MTSKDMLTALDLHPVDPLPEDTAKYFAICEEKLGLVPNVLKANACDIEMLNAFTALYNKIMLADSGLSKLEREMIAVTVSSENKCFYCLTAHGAAGRELSGDPILGEMLVMNYRVADLSPKQRAMLDFSVLVTKASATILEKDRQALRDVGWTDKDIWDIANTAAFYNMTNRVSSSLDMRPNTEYHSQSR